MTPEDGGAWTSLLSVGRVRVARPTDQLDALHRFYGEGIGLPEIGSFTGHSGYSGVFFGMPDQGVQLEFTQHDDGSPCPAPSEDNLLVLYFEDGAAVDSLRDRLAVMGFPAVEPENPYWVTVEDSVTVADPDGWRVVLVKPRLTTNHRVEPK